MVGFDFLNKRAKTALEAIIKALQLADEIRQSTHVHTFPPAEHDEHRLTPVFGFSKKLIKAIQTLFGRTLKESNDDES